MLHYFPRYYFSFPHHPPPTKTLKILLQPLSSKASGRWTPLSNQYKPRVWTADCATLQGLRSLWIKKSGRFFPPQKKGKFARPWSLPTCEGWEQGDWGHQVPGLPSLLLWCIQARMDWVQITMWVFVLETSNAQWESNYFLFDKTWLKTLCL